MTEIYLSMYNTILKRGVSFLQGQKKRGYAYVSVAFSIPLEC